jgi:hypothetical protein
MNHSRPRITNHDAPTPRFDTVATFPGTNEIGERANQLFIEGGRHLTMIPEYWRRAEEELLDRAARRVIGPGFDPSLKP